MSEPKAKYVTFRDLHTATLKPAQKMGQPLPDSSFETPPLNNLPTSSDHDLSGNKLDSQTLPSTTRYTSSTSIPSESKAISATSSTSSSSTTSTTGKKDTSRRLEKSPNVEESEGQKAATSSEAIAPSRDFQRVPNSVVRNALSEGIFRGKSKQVWDYFWSVSRGSIIPVRQVRKSRREIQKGAGLGSMVTVDAAIQHLEEVGLIKVMQSVGSLQGNTYEVFTPEEVNPRYTSTTRSSRSSSPTQKLVLLDIPESSTTSITQVPENSATYELSKTFFKTDDEANDDTHTGEQFFAAIREAAKQVCGGTSNRSEQEKERWKELGELLAEELKAAAARATSVSSPPAFFAAHLRRVLKKQRTTSNRTEEKTSHRRDHQVPPQPQVEMAEEASPKRGSTKSIYSFEERRRYATNQQPYLGNGWMVESGIGKYDEVVGAWLKEQNGEQGESLVDATACPDCRGSGMYYPGGFENGAAKCRHEKLATSKA